MNTRSVLWLIVLLSVALAARAEEQTFGALGLESWSRQPVIPVPKTTKPPTITLSTRSNGIEKMNWDAVAAIGEIVGALGVILTLAYLAVQVRRNTEEMRSGQTQDLITANSEANYYLASDSGIGDIVQTGMFDRENLSDSDRFRFNVFWFAAYNRFDFAYHQFTRGR